jgi:hypothetical protein
MNSDIKLLDTVALLDAVTARDFATGEMVSLPRGLTGAIIEVYAEAFEVEFVGTDGQTIAMIVVPAEKLLKLTSKLENVKF